MKKDCTCVAWILFLTHLLFGCSVCLYIQWAVFRSFVHMLLKQKDGKYVLMRNPNKSTLHLYSVPSETFEDDE